MGVTRSGRGRIIDSGSILFLVFSALVLAGFAIWITVIARRASRLTRASDVRLEADLSSAVAEATGTAPKRLSATTHDGAIMFSDELPPIGPTSVPEPIPVAELGPTPPVPSDSENRSAVSVGTEGPTPDLDPIPVAEVPEARTSAAADIESRLDTLADLHSRGVITEDELATARLKILAE